MKALVLVSGLIALPLLAVAARYGSVSPCSILKKQTIEYATSGAMRAGSVDLGALEELNRKAGMAVSMLSPMQCARGVYIGVAKMDPNRAEAREFLESLAPESAMSDKGKK